MNHKGKVVKTVRNNAGCCDQGAVKMSRLRDGFWWNLHHRAFQQQVLTQRVDYGMQSIKSSGRKDSMVEQNGQSRDQLTSKEFGCGTRIKAKNDKGTRAGGIVKGVVDRVANARRG